MRTLRSLGLTLLFGLGLGLVLFTPSKADAYYWRYGAYNYPYYYSGYRYTNPYNYYNSYYRSPYRYYTWYNSYPWGRY